MPAPKRFSLADHSSRVEVLKFLADLKRVTKVHGGRVRIDFSRTVQMFPCGTLLFAAELDSVNRFTKPRRLVTSNQAIDGVVDQVLQHVGVYRMLQANRSSAITADNVRYWRVDSGTAVTGSCAESLVVSYSGLFDESAGERLYSGITEAMTNCKHHAYEPTSLHDTFDVGSKGRWWMFSELRDGRLSVAFCDLGIGIPASLATGRKWGVALIEDLLGRFGLGKKDSSMIRIAMELGTSRTNEEYRGKGLRELRDAILSKDGRFSIYSNRGFYSFTSTDQSEVCRDFRDTVGGTLIQWSVPTSDRTTKETNQ